MSMTELCLQFLFSQLQPLRRQCGRFKTCIFLICRLLMLLHDKRVKRIILLSDGRSAIVEVGITPFFCRCQFSCCCTSVCPAAQEHSGVVSFCAGIDGVAVAVANAISMQIPVENTESDFETVTYDRRNVQ